MMKLFRLLPIVWQLGIALAIAGLTLGAAVAVYASIYHKGVAHERAQQKERDDEAVRDAGEARSAVDACLDAGGVWDQSRAKCDRR